MRALLWVISFLEVCFYLLFKSKKVTYTHLCMAPTEILKTQIGTISMICRDVEGTPDIANAPTALGTSLLDCVDIGYSSTVSLGCRPVGLDPLLLSKVALS